MKIHVLSELRQPIGSVSSFELENDTLNADGVEVKGLHGVVSMVRTDRGLLVTVNGDGLIQEQCARCLTPAESPVHVRFTEEYLPTIDADTGAPLRFSNDNDEFRIGKDFFLDLSEGVRQYVLLSEPAKPLCRPDCRGLCPECGADRNQGPCSCSTPTDARWHVLAALTNSDEGR